MLPSLDTVTTEVARRIVFSLPVNQLPALLLVSRTVRRTFKPHDIERSFALAHLCQRSQLGESLDDIRFGELPHVYAGAWLALFWNVEELLWLAKDMRSGGPGGRHPGRRHPKQFELVRPHRPLNWLERAVTLALKLVTIETAEQCQLGLSLAVALDSVAVAELTLINAFGSQRPAKSLRFTNKFDPATPQNDLAWMVAWMATRAASSGALRVLAYALHHPTCPVAIRLSDRKNSLIHHASAGGWVEIVHHLQGLPLPILMPVPIAESKLFRFRLREAKPPPLKNRTVIFSNENPAAAINDHNDAERAPPLHALLRFPGDCIPALNYFLSHGARLDQRDVLGRRANAIHVAAAENYPDAIRLMGSAGADINSRLAGRRNGDTALHIVAERGYVECVKVLLELGATVNPLNMAGLTPLKCAMDHGHDEVVKLLVRARTRLLVKDERGGNRVSVRLGRADVIKYMC
ncbi:hypothetical protein HDU96_008961 [Phlyctochytrium bullatum]|nr:hypothetical protein HDU96_008961 [Phlyctochytrium bullatum]